MPLHDKAFYLAFFFIAGTLAGGFGLKIWWALLGASLVSKIIFQANIKRSLIFVFIFFFGFFYHHLLDVLNKDIIPFGQDTHFEGLIVEEPQEGIESTRITVELYKPHKGEVWLYATPGISFEYGDEVSFESSVEISPGGMNIA